MHSKLSLFKPLADGKKIACKKIGGPLMWGLLLLGVPAWAQDVQVGQHAFQASDYLGQVVLSLILVVGLIFAAAGLLRRFTQWPGQKGQAIEILSAVAVGRQEKLLLVQVGGQQLLIGVTPSRISVLHTLAEPVQLVDNASDIPTGAFAQRLQDAIKSYQQRGKTD
ncbi:MAG TPA: flagellar biosynthetic protein FliO [Sulfurivirga caldicuralii]|nr:flagellar biosynthetic protein FliO [Sulfurivirga caldicuralii]